MTRKEYESRTEKQFLGKKVRSTRPLSNGHAKLPSGTVFTIERKFKGFSLRSEPCASCGVQIRITRVPERDVELIVIWEAVSA